MSEKIAPNVTTLVGRTPLVRLARVVDSGGAQVCVKLEQLNPSGSVKDRAALSIVAAAEREGQLTAGATIVEATSGNTGVSLAMIAAVRGYKCVLVMPEDMSLTRRHLLRAYGAELVLTRAEDGMRGAVDRALMIAKERGGFLPRQFDNPANPAAHSETAREILEACYGRLDAFVAGVGTGGTVSGTGRALKLVQPDVRVIAVEPRASAVISGGKAGAHGIQGLGAGFVPANLERTVLDDVVAVSDVAAERMMRRLAREEGILCGPSSGANVHVAVEFAARMRPTERVVTIVCDTGERYLA